MNFNEESLKVHKENKGKLETKSKIKLTKENLSILYTPGVAAPVREIVSNEKNSFVYTPRSEMVAVISDGTSVLGLGDVGATAAYPVMEGKSILFKELAGISAIPLCVNAKSKEDFVNIVKSVAINFGAINLEDIKAPECFYIEKELQNLGIPVMHDDQHATAVVIVAGLMNAMKVVNKNVCGVKTVINGAGAAANATAKLLNSYCGIGDIIVCDSKGIIYEGRSDLENTPHKLEIAKITNRNKIKGNLEDALINAEIFIGLSTKNVLSKEMVKKMSKDPIIFAMANPDPEILPSDAKEAGAKIIATGRSDFKNQVNNVLVFPGIFKGALEAGATRITESMKISAAIALSNLIENPTEDEILPHALDERVVPAVSSAVKKVWEEENKK